jgi:dTDP-4-dehydrorhamnose reductase
VKKVLILGSDGFLGNALLENLNKKKLFLSVYGTSRRDNKKVFFDLKKKNYIDFGIYNIVVIAASLTNIDFCEKNKKLAYEINYKSTIKIIKQIVSSGCNVLFLSSNSVFDGTKQFYKSDDKKKPYTIYGKTKSLVEDWIISKKFNSCSILRLTKILQKNFKSEYIKKWKKEIKEKKFFSIYSNHHISPILIDEAVDAITKCILSNKHGIYQIGGEEEISYYKFARNICCGNKKLLKKIKIVKKEDRNFFNSLRTSLPRIYF